MSNNINHTTESESKRSKNAYIIKKLEEENELKSKIRTSFDSPSEYLNIQPNMIIGKLYFYNKFNFENLF